MSYLVCHDLVIQGEKYFKLLIYFQNSPNYSFPNKGILILNKMDELNAVS